MSQPDESPAAMFQRKLHVDPSLAQALEAAGFTSIDEVAYVPFTELMEVPGLTDESATALRRIALTYVLSEPIGPRDDR